jgi:hypothetical protein
MTATELSDRKIFVFWLPLASTWLMMSLEGPFLAAVVARLPQPTENLAAYAVAFAFAAIVESPVIMLLSTSTALVRDRESFVSLRRFALRLGGALTLVMLLASFPPLFRPIASGLLHLPEQVARLTREALIFLLPWPASIGYRRFYQGLLIRNHLTRWVAYGTVLRVLGMGVGALAAARWTSLPGASVGAVGLSVGVVAESIATRVIAQRVVRVVSKQEGGKQLGLNEILSFYLPLALTSSLAMAVQPVVTFFMGHSRMALESLAVLPVVQALSFLFRSLGLAYQEVGVALLTDRLESYRRLKDFGVKLAVVGSGGLALIAFTPLSQVWFVSVSGLKPDLAQFAVLPTRILTLLPALTVLLTVERALLIHSRRTRPITGATLTEVIAIGVVLYLGIDWLGWVGVTAATTALLVGRVAGNLFLIPFCWKAVAKLEPGEPATAVEPAGAAREEKSLVSPDL